MRDTRLFKMTREHGRIEYGHKPVASAKCGHGGYSYHHGKVVKIEATNAEATDGWKDVSAEFGR